MLPDGVLLDIFDFYRINSGDSVCWWQLLIDVCRRWRQIIFASSLRLDLKFICTPRTRVRERLNILPPSMPITINSLHLPDHPQACSALSLEDGNQIITAIEQRHRVCSIFLVDLSSSLLEKLAMMLRETFPTLTQVLLWASDKTDETAPVLPDDFLGSVPLLERFSLRGIPFPELPKLILSTSNLVQLRLQNIPDSGYFAPEAMATSLSTCPKLEALVIEFSSPYPHPDLINQQSTSIARSPLPALVYFSFKGNGGYLDNLVLGIESPLVMYSATLTVCRRVQYEASFTPSGFMCRCQDGIVGYLEEKEEELEEGEEEEEELEEEEEELEAEEEELEEGE